MRVLAFAIYLALAGAQKEAAGDCSAAKAEAASLRKRLAAAEAEIQQLRGDLEAARATTQDKQEPADLAQQCAAQGHELSVLGAVSKTGSIAGGVLQHLLEQTSLDDQVVDAVSGHVGAAKDFTVDVVGQLAKVDYNEYVKNLTQHEIYVSHVAPAVGKVAQGAQPYMDLYVSPALESAKVYTNPALATAKETYANAAKTVEADVLPALKRSSSQAMSEVPRLLSLLRARLGVLLEPPFAIAAKAAPRHAAALPKSPVDRLLAICCLALFAYYAARVGLIALRLAMRMAFRSAWLVFKLAVALPLLLMRKLLSYSLWLATGFYCCGLCGRRGKRAQRLAGEAKKQAAATNGNAVPAKSASGPPAKVTAAELAQALEAGKKKGKLEATAKLLVGMAGTGKPTSGKDLPENVRGKLLEKDLLKKALGKFKELDFKKLGL
mmetsp:Transcript_58277/g.161119  ORF Transcript_58277/g.161119 Transcript_58277/m.161119 type:complete len:437 (-) Transcript_58277:107-1417(-)